jgi:hypothetical protein
MYGPLRLVHGGCPALPMIPVGFHFRQEISRWVVYGYSPTSPPPKKSWLAKILVQLFIYFLPTIWPKLARYMKIWRRDEDMPVYGHHLNSVQLSSHDQNFW